MGYSTEFRVQTLTYCTEGHTDVAAAKKFDVAPCTIHNWKKQLIETGNLAPKERKNDSKRIGELLDKFKQTEAIKASESNNVKPADMSDIMTKPLLDPKQNQTGVGNASADNNVNPADALSCNKDKLSDVLTSPLLNQKPKKAT